MKSADIGTAFGQRRDFLRDVEIGFLNANGRRDGHGIIFFLTRFLPQISLRNLRKLDCYANRYPLRSKTLCQPPVIGGKNAISRAPDIAASGLTWLWSIAARITFGFSKA